LTTLDTEHRRLCHTVLDAIEQADLATVEQCYAPGMTMWNNLTGEESTREENLATLAAGSGLHRRRTYNDRIINTFDDGFMAQYTTHVVTHRGDSVALSACLVAEVRDGRITRLFDYLDSGKFSKGRPRA
jgi:ketosteroid isomerase-like protein